MHLSQKSKCDKFFSLPTLVCSLVLKLVGRIDLSLRLFVDEESSDVGLSLLFGCDDDEGLFSRPAAALMRELELDEDEEHTEEEPITPCSELTELRLGN